MNSEETPLLAKTNDFLKTMGLTLNFWKLRITGTTWLAFLFSLKIEEISFDPIKEFIQKTIRRNKQKKKTF